MQSITSFLAFCAFHTQVSALALQGAGASGRAVAAGREEAALRSEMMSAMSKRQPLSRTKIFETSLNSSNDTSNETCLNETIPWLQIGFAMDCTGSTQPYLDALKTTVYDLAVEFNASVSLLQMAFLCYRDEGDVTPPRYEWAVHPDPLSHWFEDPVQLQNEIAPFYSMGGGDSPEDNAGAMGQMLHNNPWDPSAVKILMVISKDRDSMRTPYDTDASQCQLMQDIRAANISLILGHLDNGVLTSMLYDSTHKPTDPWRGCYADPSDPHQLKEVQFMGVSAHNFSSMLIEEICDTIDGPSVQVVPTPAPTDAGGATDDPHVVNLGGEKFDVNMPGSYVLVRAPRDPRLPAKLELNASVQPFAGHPCGNYIQSVELSGEWLGGQVVRVVPLHATRRARTAQAVPPSAPSPCGCSGVPRRSGVPRPRPPASTSHGGASATRARSLSGRVRLVPVWRQVYADAGRAQEAQAFQFLIRGAGAGYDATLEVAQAAHQALNFRATNLRSLGFEQLGGLIGTDEHGKWVEQVSDLCRAFRARPSRLSRRVAAEPEEPGRPSMAASWD
ncbi:unnamed protein product [Prorocentrum cordatum]|uniref:VWFA domain-containing protein n=1 Tax=Prorocentrum cordatum TaxID=2364126 RepID=A0ABN9TDH4_9DINO|nr:unnamed protein product [Polarella glacialis]